MAIEPKQKKIRLDQLLTEKNYAPTRTKAQAMILAGLVLVNNETVTKAGTLIHPEADIFLKETLKYVSRGGTKLEGALKELQINVEGLDVLDVGASTGGFTDCVLQNGRSTCTPLTWDEANWMYLFATIQSHLQRIFSCERTIS
jgi:23S rRNA (cytidine1920-2'-O)/16S rRNA (cytidine1409-2'-O)-methyltransferase